MTTSSTLLAKVNAQEPDAWDRFTVLYRPLVLHWCRQKRLPPADADDVARDVFNTVAGEIHRFTLDRNAGSLRGWLRAAVRDAITDRTHQWARHPVELGGDDAQRVLEEIPKLQEPDTDDREEKDILIRQAFDMTLANYRDHTREAFWRVVVNRQNPEEVAKDLGIAVHVVYLAKSRVLNRLQQEFGGFVDLDRDLKSD